MLTAWLVESLISWTQRSGVSHGKTYHRRWSVKDNETWFENFTIILDSPLYQQSIKTTHVFKLETHRIHVWYIYIYLPLFTYILLIFMVNVGIYTIHGSYRYWVLIATCFRIFAPFDPWVLFSGCVCQLQRFVQFEWSRWTCIACCIL